MANDKSLRKHLVYVLTNDSAHPTFEAAIKDFPAALRGKKPKGADHSAWELLEHLRIAQRDILEYARSADYESPVFPEGYWPPTAAPPSPKAWNESVKRFRDDRAELIEMIQNDSTDLFVSVPQDKSKTILRQALITAVHNSYHLGQLVQLRKILGAWEG